MKTAKPRPTMTTTNSAAANCQQYYFSVTSLAEMTPTKAKTVASAM